MAFCPKCNVEQLGGGRCSRCGRRLVEKRHPPPEKPDSVTGPGDVHSGPSRSRPLPYHITVLERESRYKAEKKRRGFVFYLVAFIARCFESALYCVAFHFILVTVLFMISSVTELTRTGGEIYEASWPQELKKGILLYEYFSFALITLLTFKYRWPKK
jgi:hypothetical protein